MKQKTPIAMDVEIADTLAAYDTQAKKLLSNKPFLAWIMKTCTEEFADCSISTIIGCIEETEVSTEPVDQDEELAVSKIQGLANEDKSICEGAIYYDIRFQAAVPESDEKIQLFINVEAQLRDRGLGYPITKRVVYYLSRMVSGQKGRIFQREDYGKIRKVYSIWIVSEPHTGNENTIVKFQIKPEYVYGRATYEKCDYDLMTGVMVNLNAGDRLVDNKILKLFNVLLAPDMESGEKEDILESEYSLPMTEDIRQEVNGMCNLSLGVYEKGIEQGIERKKAEDIVSYVENATVNFGVTTEQACAAFKISVEEYNMSKELVASLSQTV